MLVVKGSVIRFELLSAKMKQIWLLWYDFYSLSFVSAEISFPGRRPWDYLFGSICQIMFPDIYWKSVLKSDKYSGNNEIVRGHKVCSYTTVGNLSQKSEPWNISLRARHSTFYDYFYRSGRGTPLPLPSRSAIVFRITTGICNFHSLKTCQLKHEYKT